MKRTVKIMLVVVLILILLILSWIFYFYYQGLKPAFAPLVNDVTQQLPQANQNINTVVNLNTPVQQPSKVQRGPFTVLGDFQIDIFAKGLNTPRVLIFDAQNNLLVSVMGEGKVYAFKPDGIKVALAMGLNNPHGLAIKDNYLYIAESDKVSRYVYDPVALKLGKKEKLFDLSGTGLHITRTINFGPDGNLYVAVGSDCNVCDEKDNHRAAILKYNPTDWSYEVFANGLRNIVFFTLNPLTQEFWGNDMGRDWLGDTLPPDELNIVKPGNYGWPICYGNKINDRDFDKRIYVRDPCIDTIAPIFEYSAHESPLGLTFINSPMFPADWQNDLLVSLHGSWNSSVPVGYKVVHLKVKSDQIVSSEDFITGFLAAKGAIGRPVDLLFSQDGVLYLSDDKAGVIYKIYK